MQSLIILDSTNTILLSGGKIEIKYYSDMNLRKKDIAK